MKVRLAHSSLPNLNRGQMKYRLRTDLDSSYLEIIEGHFIFDIHHLPSYQSYYIFRCKRSKICCDLECTGGHKLFTLGRKLAGYTLCTENVSDGDTPKGVTTSREGHAIITIPLPAGLCRGCREERMDASGDKIGGPRHPRGPPADVRSDSPVMIPEGKCDLSAPLRYVAVGLPIKPLRVIQSTADKNI